jgi:hypothetical protein
MPIFRSTLITKGAPPKKHWRYTGIVMYTYKPGDAFCAAMVP